MKVRVAVICEYEVEINDRYEALYGLEWPALTAEERKNFQKMNEECLREARQNLDLTQAPVNYDVESVDYCGGDGWDGLAEW